MTLTLHENRLYFYLTKALRRRGCSATSRLASRAAQLLQGVLKAPQLLPHLAQGALDPAGLVQDLHRAGERVVAYRERPLDGSGVPPERVLKWVCWFSGTVAVCKSNICAPTRITSAGVWRPQSSQTQSKQAGRSGPGRAAPPPPPGRTACTPARWTGRAGWRQVTERSRQ